MCSKKLPLLIGLQRAGQPRVKLANLDCKLHRPKYNYIQLNLGTLGRVQPSVQPGAFSDGFPRCLHCSDSCTCHQIWHKTNCSNYESVFLFVFVAADQRSDLMYLCVTNVFASMSVCLCLCRWTQLCQQCAPDRRSDKVQIFTHNLLSHIPG